MRPLKYHEKKLLKKVDFVHYRGEKNVHEIEVMRRYHIQNREDYHKYNKLCGSIQQLAKELHELPANDEFRIEMTDTLLERLVSMGILTQKKGLGSCSRVAVAQFCRRRLPVAMCRLKMSQTVKSAVELVEQGHVRVGTQVVTDPAFLVTRDREDFVTWVDTSKIKKTVMDYRDQRDDFDLL